MDDTLNAAARGLNQPTDGNQPPPAKIRERRNSLQRHAPPPTWIVTSIRRSSPVAEARHSQGMIDTSVVIDLDKLDAEELPAAMCVSAITKAELAGGPHAATDPEERARRQDRLQTAEATFGPVPFDTDAAHAYGLVVKHAERACSICSWRRLPSLKDTRNPDNFKALEDLLEIVAV